ncbi:DUF4214 domain-containing protein [Aquamicrobium terrae]|uniref:DUF4214 domain-containing protein n=1 Tax=Aquamicrobium terrae TaxID=1324945 RepID=A0ABV2MZL5_9HYPH
MIARLCVALAALLGATAAWGADLMWGVNGHPFTAYPGISFARQLDFVRDLGMKSYRVNISTADDIPELAALVEQARARDIDILPVITPDLDLDAETAGDLYAKSYAMAVAMVSRFKDDIRVWELGNELENYAILTACEMRDDGIQYDCSWGPAGGDGPGHYFTPRWKQVSAVLRGLSDGTASVDPTIRKAIGTAGWGHTGAFERMIADGIDWDISVWHHYGADLKQPLDYLKTLGKPIWVTEFNHSSEKGEQAQADGLLEMMTLLRGYRQDYPIEAAHIYELLDEPYWAPSFEAVMGLVRLRKTDKGAWTPDGVKLAYGVAKAFIAAGGSSVAVPQSPAQTSQPASADPVPPAAGCDTGSLNTAVVNHANQVAYFYCLALNRLPNPTEQWRQALAMKQGRTVAEMMASVLETPEFSKVNGREEATNAAYIAAIYRRLLGREPDGRGLSDYLSRLDGNQMTREELALEAVGSQEFRSLHSFLFAQVPVP